LQVEELRESTFSKTKPNFSIIFYLLMGLKFVNMGNRKEKLQLLIDTSQNSISFLHNITEWVIYYHSLKDEVLGKNN